MCLGYNIVLIVMFRCHMFSWYCYINWYCYITQIPCFNFSVWRVNKCSKTGEKNSADWMECLSPQNGKKEKLSSNLISLKEKKNLLSSYNEFIEQEMGLLHNLIFPMLLWSNPDKTIWHMVYYSRIFPILK